MLKADLIKAIVHSSARLAVPANTEGTVPELETRLAQLEQDLAKLESSPERVESSELVDSSLERVDSPERIESYESGTLELNSPEPEKSSEPENSLERVNSPERIDSPETVNSLERMDSPAGSDWILLVSNTTVETCNDEGEKLRLVKNKPQLVAANNARILLSLPYVSKVESDQSSELI